MNSLGYESGTGHNGSSESRADSERRKVNSRYSAQERSAIVAQMLLQRRADRNFQATSARSDNPIKPVEEIYSLAKAKPEAVSKKGLNADLKSDLKLNYNPTSNKPIQTKRIISEITLPMRSTSQKPNDGVTRVEDRLMAYKKNHGGWVAQEKFKRANNEILNAGGRPGRELLRRNLVPDGSGDLLRESTNSEAVILSYKSRERRD